MTVARNEQIKLASAIAPSKSLHPTMTHKAITTAATLAAMLFVFVALGGYIGAYYLRTDCVLPGTNGCWRHYETKFERSFFKSGSYVESWLTGMDVVVNPKIGSRKLPPNKSLHPTAATSSVMESQSGGG
jgi:hypothetical protein